MMRPAIVVALLVLGSLGAAAQHTHQHVHENSHQHRPASKSVAASGSNGIFAPSKTCRKGAFTDAMALINASVRASRSLAIAGSGTSTVALAELDSILGIAIGQASSEFDCVKGTLVMGYDKNFADTAKLAGNHAKARNMAPAYFEQAQQLSKSIELAGAPAIARK